MTPPDGHEETAARPLPQGDPLAAPRARRGRRRTLVLAGLFLALTLLVLVSLRGVGAWPFGPNLREETAELVSAEGTKVSVRARVLPGSLRIIADPEARASTAWKVLAPPVRFEAEEREGAFHVTFEPAEGVQDGLRDAQPEVLCLSAAQGTTPVGAVRHDDGTITAETTCETVTIGRTEQSDVDQQVATPLEDAIDASDPLAPVLLAGGANDTACTTDDVLVGRRGGNDTEDFCAEYQADRGTYRLALGNWRSVPYVFTLPADVTRTDATTPDQTSGNPLVAFFAGDRHQRAAFVASSGGALKTTYPPSAATPGASLVGQPDVAGWLLLTMRENLLATAGRNADGSRGGPQLALIDQAVASQPVTECVTKAATALTPTSTIQDTAAVVRSGYGACLPTAVAALARTYAEINGGHAERIADRLTETMNATDQHAARADTTFRRLLVSSFRAPRASDPVARTIPVTRFMTKEEVFALPLTSQRGPFAASRCPTPPREGGPRPMGVPPWAVCMYVLEADLDGNGAPDRAITWTSGRSDGRVVRGSSSRMGQGAVAHLDGGRVARLPAAEATSGWLLDFEAIGGAYLGNDARQQLVVEYDDAGAHTVWFVVVGLGSDGSLHVARDETGHALTMPVDGARFSGSGYGCYSRDGQGRLARWSWTATVPAVGDSRRTPGRLRVTPLEMNDLVVTRATGDLTYVTPDHPNLVDHPVGGPCTQADPARRGDYGVHVPGARVVAAR